MTTPAMLSGASAARAAQASSQVVPAWQWGMALAGMAAALVVAQTGLHLEAGALAVLSLAPLVIGLDRRMTPGLLVGPATMMYIFHALGYAIGPVGQVTILRSLTVIERGFVSAQWGAAAGLVTFVLAYPLVFQAVARRRAERVINAPAEAKAWFGYALLLAGAAFFVVVFGYVSGAGNRLAGTQDQVSAVTGSAYSAFQNVHQVVFFFLAYAAARRRGGWFVFWVGLLGAYAMFFLLDGSRGTVVTACLTSAMGLVFGGLSTRVIWLLGLVGALVFVPLASVVHSYRLFYVDRPESLAERFAGFEASISDFVDETSQGRVVTSQVFLERITAETVDRVFILTPRVIPFAGFEDIERVALIYLPRAILPDRPDLLDGSELAIRYGTVAEGSAGASYMPAVGDGYRRFGWPGVVAQYVLSAIVFGVAMAVAWGRRERREWAAMVVFLSILGAEIWSATLLGTIYTTLWIIPKYLVFFWALRWLQDRLREVLSVSSRLGS